MKIIYSSSTNKGRRRENQDRICVLKNGAPVFAIFDGMGGEQQGKTASIIASNIMEKYSGKITADQLCMKINKEICDYMVKNQVYRMGTTAAIVEFYDGYVYTCNIGDSRIYKIADNEIEQLSVDHVINAGRFKTRRVLTQYLGIPKDDFEIEPYTEKHMIRLNDVFVVCSDGLTDMVTDENIRDIVLKNKTKDSAEELMKAAIESGGKDNISVIVCRITN